MRLDLFLKLARLVKRRTIAQEMISVGAVRLNERAAKPSSTVRPGDKVAIAFPRRLLVVEVVSADETAIRRGAECYGIVEDRRIEADTTPW